MASEHKAQSGVLAALQGDVDTRVGNETRALRQQIDELQVRSETGTSPQKVELRRAAVRVL